MAAWQITERPTYETSVITQARIQKGYSQQEVANLIGINVRQYQKFECGIRDIRNASMRIGLAVCAILDLDPYELTFRGEYRSAR